VQEALKAPSAKALRSRLEGLPPRRFNAFHLFYADQKEAFVLWSDGDALHHQALEPGIQVVTESSFGAEPAPRDAAVRERFTGLLGAMGTPSLDRLEQFLRHHEDDPRASICVHAPALNYGTRSSTVLFLGRPLAKSQLWWTEGHPCEGPFLSRADLLEELRGQFTSAAGRP
jgi:hypothetical protein